MQTKGLAALVALTLWFSLPMARADEAKEGCGNHGTTVEFLDTPSLAARQALKEEKLVFVLHVSGNFEEPRYT
jgi:hypothetical protein